MVKYTNNLGLPQSIVAAIENDEYSRGESDISITGLLSPPRQQALLNAGSNEIVKDVSDEIYALQGKSMHSLLETAGHTSEQVIKERRLSAVIDGDLGPWVVSGKFDELAFMYHAESDAWRIDDYKNTSGYVVASSNEPGSRVDHWKLQLNMYRYLVMNNDVAELKGLPVTRLRLVMIIRDWSKMKAFREPDFPQKQVVVQEAGIIGDDLMKSMMIEMVSKHQQAQYALDNGGQDAEDFPKCGPEDMWEQPTKYALMKSGRKSAIRVMDDKDALLNFALSKEHAVVDPTDKKMILLNNGFSIDVRPGSRTRCQFYCDAAGFCNQYQNWLKEQDNGANE